MVRQKFLPACFWGGGNESEGWEKTKVVSSLRDFDKLSRDFRGKAGLNCGILTRIHGMVNHYEKFQGIF